MDTPEVGIFHVVAGLSPSLNCFSHLVSSSPPHGACPTYGWVKFGYEVQDLGGYVRPEEETAPQCLLRRINEKEKSIFLSCTGAHSSLCKVMGAVVLRCWPPSPGACWGPHCMLWVPETHLLGTWISLVCSLGTSVSSSAQGPVLQAVSQAGKCPRNYLQSLVPGRGPWACLGDSDLAGRGGTRAPFSKHHTVF